MQPSSATPTPHAAEETPASALLRELDHELAASGRISNRSGATRAGSPGRPVCLFDEDPELAECVPESELPIARRAAVTSVIELPAGPWIAEKRPPEPSHLGYLVLDGLLSRELHIAGARSVELLGAGDIVRPWQEDSASFSVSRYRAVIPARLAVLDTGLAERIVAWPQMTTALVERAVRRSRTLAAVAAIGHVVGIEQRLEALFWCLAERWGTVSREGVSVPLPLTHQTLADLVGAQRPSVTTALGRLSRAGTLTRMDDRGWMLHSEPPVLEVEGGLEQTG